MREAAALDATRGTTREQPDEEIDWATPIEIALKETGEEMKSPVRKPRKEAVTPAEMLKRVPHSPADIHLSISIPTAQVSPTGHLIKKKIKLWPRE